MLQRRGETYASRVVVPADLRETLGRNEVLRSLRTGDRREAEHRRALWEAHLAALFATIRGGTMSADKIDTLARRYLAASFAEIEDRLAMDWGSDAAHEAGRDEHTWALVEEARRLRAMLAYAERGEFLELARAMLPDADDRAQRKLARRLIEAKLEATDAELEAFDGEPLRMPEALRTPSGSPEVARETPRVSAVAKQYGDERMTDGKWTPKTELQNRTILEVLADLLGDPPIGDVTKEDVRDLGRDIVSLPSNMNKRFPGKTPREILEAAGDRADVPRLAPRSVNKYRQMARSLFAWAAEHDVIAQSPATVLKDVKEGRARDDRKPFTDDDLRTYFRRLDEEPERPELYWLPRILAYSGMRLGEAAQLTTSDLKKIGDLWVWDVNEDTEGKRLKTDASRRLVPVHSRLLELGLLGFAQGVPGGHLFDAQWRTTDNPQRGAVDKLSKLLNRRLRVAGISDPKKTGAHSFRHTVSARLKAAGVLDYQLADLLGHEDDDISTGRYGDVTPLPALAEALEALQLPI